MKKEILAPVREKAGYVIDTSDLTANQLRERLAQILLGDDKEVMNLHVMSFGFKHGIPNDADFVLDVRCLPNPYWIESMRNKTGLDQEVKDYVFSFEEAHEILKDSRVCSIISTLFISERARARLLLQSAVRAVITEVLFLRKHSRITSLASGTM